MTFDFVQGGKITGLRRQQVFHERKKKAFFLGSILQIYVASFLRRYDINL